MVKIEPAEFTSETALLSEAALSDWLSAEEDRAWSYLQTPMIPPFSDDG